MFRQLNAVLISMFFLCPTSWSSSCIEGYTSVQSAHGIEMCSDGNNVVHIIDLTMSVKIRSIYDNSAYPQGNNQFQSLPMETLWSKFKQVEPTAFSVVNGTFFAPFVAGDYEDVSGPSNLAFLVKEGSEVVSKGYDSADDYDFRKVLKVSFLDQKAIIDDDKDYGDIKDYDFALGGLALNASSKYYTALKIDIPTGRHLVGVNHSGEKLYSFVAKSMKISAAEEAIKKFGATSSMMLDGSGSAQVRSDAKVVYGDSRPIPHAFGFVPGTYKAQLNPNSSCKFPDITIYSPYYKVICSIDNGLFSRGYVSGDSGKIQLERNISRAEFTKVISFAHAKVNDLPPPDQLDIDTAPVIFTFKDIPKNDFWPYKYIYHAYKYGIVKGYVDQNIFDPNGKITYQGVAKLIFTSLFDVDQNTSGKWIADSAVMSSSVSENTYIACAEKLKLFIPPYDGFIHNEYNINKSIQRKAAFTAIYNGLLKKDSFSPEKECGMKLK